MAQPTVPPLPTDLRLAGLVAVVTGATAGLGLETAKQLLQRGTATVVLAARNVPKGEACAAALLADPKIRKANPNGKAEVIKLDLTDFESVKGFAAELERRYPVVNLLVLNAGAASIKHERTRDGHEVGQQAFYLSNALLIDLLLPHLERSTAVSLPHRVSRITWIGSRMAWIRGYSFAKTPIPEASNIIQYRDDPAHFSAMTQYNDVKLLCYMYVQECAGRIDAEKCTINILCPGMVATDFEKDLPWFVRGPVKVLKAWRGRPIEQAGWVILHAGTVADAKSHGKMLFDKNDGDKHEWADASQGVHFRKRLWKDTIAETEKIADVPAALQS